MTGERHKAKAAALDSCSDCIQEIRIPDIIIPDWSCVSITLPEMADSISSSIFAENQADLFVRIPWTLNLWTLQ